MMRSSSSQGPVGIIGVGLVGTAMAERLGAAGFEVFGFDLEPFDHRLAAPCGSPQGLAGQCTTVLLSLPTSAVVGAVLEQLVPSVTPGHLIIDTTTGDPGHAEEHGALLRPSGAALVEATIAGSSDLLRGGAAPVLVGGAEEAVRRAQAVLDALSDRTIHLGELGTASRFKLVFNLVLGLQRAVLAEGLHFGEALGFRPEEVLGFLQQSPASSPVMETKGERMVMRNYDPPQARLSQHLKDVRLILAQAAEHGTALPLSETHLHLLERAEALGFGKGDTSAVREAYPVHQTGPQDEC
jgi:3-hydroxyisobutyrate dehydrogenase-like beta-hydroxyacid dehydrogenase